MELTNKKMLETFLNALIHQQQKCRGRRSLERLIYSPTLSILKRFGNIYNFDTVSGCSYTHCHLVNQFQLEEHFRNYKEHNPIL